MSTYQLYYSVLQKLSNTTKSSIYYLLGLRCVDRSPFVKHRQKMFIIGFIYSGKIAKIVASDM